jgi:hypothetical protein
MRLTVAMCALAAAGAVSSDAWAVDIPDVGGETLTLDINNTTVVGYHFDNRNSTDGVVNKEFDNDDNYGEWLNRLYLRAYYWKFSLGVRLDSAVYFNTRDRDDTQQAVIDTLGAANLGRENSLNQDLHTRYSSLIYPAKLWIGFKHKRFEATLGDFYAHLGRGLVFSVRKIDEVGIDTTVRGAKLKWGVKSDDGFRFNVGAFGGQLNPIRIDFPTGRVLHGNSSLLFFGFPLATDYEQFGGTGNPPPNEFDVQTQRAKPSYLEDSVVGGNFSVGPKWAQFEGNTAFLFRQSGQLLSPRSNSEEQLICLNLGGTVDDCSADNPSFDLQEESRLHDQIRNFSGAIKIPTVEDTFDVYVEVAGQQQTNGRVTGLEAVTNAPLSREDVFGYAVYGNFNFSVGPISATIEGKRYHNYVLLGSNVDNVDLVYGAPEYNLVNYSRPPNAESIYTEPIGSPDICGTGGKVRLDAALSDEFRVYGWGAHSVSFTEANDQLESDNLADPVGSRTFTCTPEGIDPATGFDRTEQRRTNTWDGAAGGEIDLQKGKTHYWGWIGARNTDRELPFTSLAGTTTTFYRENYVRYDFNQHLAGSFSLSMLGYHRRRFEPEARTSPWHEGENLLALNWAPHFSFVFGYEYTTIPGSPPHYFNGGIQYRSKSTEHWYEQALDSVRVFVGQRREALRCVGGVCRVFPAFEGAKMELVSQF